MAPTPLEGFARGLILGLVGGLAAGSIEAISLVRDAPVARAALIEAGFYAVIVDAIGGAGIAGVLGALLPIVARIVRLRVSPDRIAALYVSGSTMLLLGLVGWLWAFRAAGGDRGAGVRPDAFAVVVLVAVACGVLVHPLAQAFALPLFARPGRLALGALVPLVLLGLVFPAQVVIEARQHAAPSGSVQGLKPVDPGLLEADFSTDLSAALAEVGTRPLDRPMNVLLLTVDALRADHVGACGNEWIQTPAIDALAYSSALSCSTYTQQPQTNPAIASIFTSLYPAVHGVRMHMVDRLADTFPTLAEVMHGAGYNTSAVIPWTSLEPAFSGFHRGFQTYEAFVLNEPPALQNPATAALAAIYRRVTDQVAVGSAVEAMLGMRQGTEAEIDGRADVTAQAALTWLANNGDAPFFLWVHFFDPHYPWTAPEPWDQLYDEGYEGRYNGDMSFVYEMRAGVFYPEPRDVQYLRALYASEVSYADHYVGQVLGYMAQRGLLQNTLVVLTADHGEELGERGESWPNGDYWLHGDDLHSTGIQVPLIIHDPRSTRGPQLLKPPIEHVDLMPTILDLVGVPIPRRLQGETIVPLLTGADDGDDRMAFTTLADDSQTAIMSAQGWKLIADRLTGGRELYYLPSDPDERVNLAAAFPDRVIALSRRLDAWAENNSVGLARSSGDAAEVASASPNSRQAAP
jgi:arylsulfatase A-like enzyme